MTSFLVRGLDLCAAINKYNSVDHQRNEWDDVTKRLKG